MIKISLTPQEIKRGKLIENPGWYGAEISEVLTKPSKGDKSTNYWVYFKGLTGEVKDMQFFRLFNEKALGFIVPFLKAAGVEVNEETGEVQNFDLQALIGRKIKLFIKVGDNQGTPVNQVDGYEQWDGV